MPARKTHYVRVKLDYVLHYDYELLGVPTQFAKIVATNGRAINDVIIQGLEGIVRRRDWGGVTILPGGKMNVRLVPGTRALDKKLADVPSASSKKRRRKKARR